MAGNFCIWNQVNGFLSTSLHLPGIHIFWSSPAPVSALENIWLIDESWQSVGDIKYFKIMHMLPVSQPQIFDDDLEIPPGSSSCGQLPQSIISRFRFRLDQLITSRSRNFLRNPEESPLPSRLQPISCIECFLDSFEIKLVIFEMFNTFTAAAIDGFKIKYKICKKSNSSKTRVGVGDTDQWLAIMVKPLTNWRSGESENSVTDSSEQRKQGLNSWNLWTPCAK